MEGRAGQINDSVQWHWCQLISDVRAGRSRGWKAEEGAGAQPGAPA